MCRDEMLELKLREVAVRIFWSVKFEADSPEEFAAFQAEFIDQTIQILRKEYVALRVKTIEEYDARKKASHD